MNKIIFKLGWPGALIILMGSLSLGIYAIVNQSFVEKETQKTIVVAEEEISKSISEEQKDDTNLNKDNQSDKKKISNGEEIKVENSSDDVSKNNVAETKDSTKKNLIEQVDTENIQVNNDSILEKENEKESNNKNKQQTLSQNQDNSEDKTLTINKETIKEVDKEETKVDILRVDESGITIIAGSADPSTTVEAKINNQTIGKSEVNKDGEFVITGEVSSSDQPQELKIITIEEKEEKTKKIISKEPVENEEDWVYETKSFIILPGLIKNNNDNEIQNERLDDVRIFEVQQTDILLKEEFKNINVEQLTLDRIKYSENGTAILYGRARTDMNVMVYLNNEFKMKTIPGKDGSWDVDLGIISPGIYKLRIDETTINGDVKFRIETPFKQETKELLDKMFTKAITVQPGNSLWRIARRIYGKGIMYLDIYNKNSHLIKDPDLIYPGQIFSLLD
ncbi:MAG: hypothetical protein CM15mP50_6750 [Rhodobacterales bacterium]|nr:MAG: hypothetical protein CM15mP50_6750 [Rhodobacterales bacterium]